MYSGKDEPLHFTHNDQNEEHSFLHPKFLLKKQSSLVHKMAGKEDYKFLQIEDARAAINQKVNLIAVVVETGLPKQSKGTDCFCIIKIIDESFPSPGMTVNFFAETMDKLPQVLTVGDIIQLSQVVMKTHGSDTYALFNKKFSSFAIFDRNNSSNFLPYQCSSKYHAREQDKKFILRLMEWLVDHQVTTGSTDFHSLKEIREGDRFNLISKILHVCEVAEDKWMLLVWDGTDTPPVTIKTKHYEERRKSKWGWMPLSSFPWPSDITETDYPKIPFTSLMKALAHPKIVGKYHCVVRVIAALPWRPEEFRSARGVYRIRLTLEDPTARIHAYLYAEDAEQFFDGYPDLYALTRKRNLLLGISEDNDGSQMDNYSRNPPWIMCCLKSYHVDESNPWGSRNFRIFATTLKV